MRPTEWTAAPAKVNLYLKVLGRRPDGYHELDSVMARLELADRVRLRLTSEPGPDRLLAAHSGPGELPPDFEGPGNLALKAAALYRRRTGWSKAGLEIFLDKRIPLGAGLGGGSADGAAVLRSLNRLAPAPLTTGELAELALSLGADVPFCLAPWALARAGGVGERLTPPPPDFQAWAGRRLMLVNPGLALSTSLVFQNLGLTNEPANNTLGPVSVPAPGENDLLVSARLLSPALDEVIEAIEALRPAHWGLSGSGPTFWLWRPEGSVGELADRHPDWWVQETAITDWESATSWPVGALSSG